jgi:metallo-beta-lactamase family protein
MDSPLAISATEIFKRNSDCFDQETKDLLSEGNHPLELSEIIYTRSTEASRTINEDTRSGIIIASSGMCDAGRIQHHLKHHLWQEKSHIVIIGYQGEGTVGRRIVDGAKTVRLFGEEIAIKAHIHTLGGFSAHADQKGLLEWLSHFSNPQLEVFVNHGEEKISIALSQVIRQQFHFKTSIPQWREKRLLFVSPEKDIPERVRPEEEKERIPLPEGTLSVLFKNLDRSYRRLRRKLKNQETKGEEFEDPQRLRTLEEINKKIEELESELK